MSALKDDQTQNHISPQKVRQWPAITFPFGRSTLAWCGECSAGPFLGVFLVLSLRAGDKGAIGTPVLHAREGGAKMMGNPESTRHCSCVARGASI